MTALHRLLQGIGAPLRRRAGRRGASSMEFALIVPVVMFVLTAVSDIGNAIQQSVRLEAAVRAGAQYALAYPNDSAGISTQVQNALPGWSNVTVSVPAMVCYCPGLTRTTVDCTTDTTCTTSLQRYLTITATRPYSPVIITQVTSVSGSVALRLQ